MTARLGSTLALLLGLGTLLSSAPALAQASASANPGRVAPGSSGSKAASGDGKEHIKKALEFMGGLEAVKKLTAVSMQIESGEGRMVETHTLQLEGRQLHYRSRRESGAGFDVVLAPKLAFLCDRDKRGEALHVEDLQAADAREGAYERDMLFMPVLLAQVLEDKRIATSYRGRNSKGHHVVRAAILPATKDGPGKPFWVRFRFHKDDGRLLTAMGHVPLGADKGKRRYLDYSNYVQVGALKLPKTFADKRGEAEPRSFEVKWNVDLRPDPKLFVKPKVEG